MHARAEELIRTLHLRPHREGGWFAEDFRSPRVVRLPGAERDRSALTTIHYLLVPGERSRWHRLDADEVWHFHEGAPLSLFVLDAGARFLSRSRLGPDATRDVRVQVVPAGSWLAARLSGDYALVGCTMGPGFEAEGLELMKDVPEVARAVAQRFPEVADLI